MKLYNTMTRRKEPLTALEDKKIHIYACGPTVYDRMHIGNGRQICIFDVLRRYLAYRGYAVTYAQNFTDIDDKIIRRAKEEGCDYQTIANTYIEEYFKDARGLNVLDADIHPRATENMSQILDIISSLIETGHAYSAANGDVYFRTASFKAYGKLSNQPLEDLVAGARITSGEEKDDPMDFAVWKAAKPGEPYWTSPFGNGRPGWHIECSAMVRSIFGGTVDIHGGGQDLIFPHHENEIAQSESCTDAPLARFWMHNGYVNVDNKKMGKSLGNFFTIREVAEQFGYEPIRFLLISSHYRSPMNYSLKGIEQAIPSLERLYNCRDNLIFMQKKAVSGVKPGEAEALTALDAYRDRFIEAMDDDLNTADGLSHIFDLARDINGQMAGDAAPSAEFCTQALALLNELCGVLGILTESDGQEVDADIEARIEQRELARKAKDWAAADAIRDELAAQGIVLEDTPNGVKWSREK